jgi:hypothetical protein
MAAAHGSHSIERGTLGAHRSSCASRFLAARFAKSNRRDAARRFEALRNVLELSRRPPKSASPRCLNQEKRLKSAG